MVRMIVGDDGRPVLRIRAVEALRIVVLQSTSVGIRNEGRNATDKAINVDSASSIDEVPTLAWVVVGATDD